MLDIILLWRFICSQVKSLVDSTKAQTVPLEKAIEDITTLMERLGVRSIGLQQVKHPMCDSNLYISFIYFITWDEDRQHFTMELIVSKWNNIDTLCNSIFYGISSTNLEIWVKMTSNSWYKWNKQMIINYCYLAQGELFCTAYKLTMQSI